MAITSDNEKTRNVGSWQEFFVPTYSERIRKTEAKCYQNARDLPGTGSNGDEDL